MQALEKGFPKEIKLLETEGWDTIEKLKVWKDDEWFKDWLKIEPKLSEIDLRPYFYFSRESLQLRNFLRCTAIKS